MRSNTSLPLWDGTASPYGECQLKPAVREQTLESLAHTLNTIFLNDRSIKRYTLPEEEPMMAAEPDSKL